MTSRECRDISPKEAKGYILGFTAGNDLSCRMFQMSDVAGGQFFYAKAFDKFAPLGPTLASSKIFAMESARLITAVNGDEAAGWDRNRHDIFSRRSIEPYEPGRVHVAESTPLTSCRLISVWSGTTIPQFTCVMTGTPAGVGVFRKPRAFLGHADLIEVEISSVGNLKEHSRVPRYSAVSENVHQTYLCGLHVNLATLLVGSPHCIQDFPS